MNLHAIVSPIIGVVNPNQQVSVKVNTGFATQADGTRVPTYEKFDIIGQVQPLTGRDLQHLEGLNLNGTLKALYLNGQIDGVTRVTAKGGDLVKLRDGSIWLVVQQLEGFDLSAGWTKVVLQLQNDKVF